MNWRAAHPCLAAIGITATLVAGPVSAQPAVPAQPVPAQPVPAQPAVPKQPVVAQPAAPTPPAEPDADEEEGLPLPVIVPPIHIPERSERERNRWVWENIIALRFNPLGLLVRFDTGYRLQIWDLPGPLFEDTFFALKFASEVTPAYGRIGGRAELQPLAMLNLHVQYQLVGGFGAFDFVESFSTPAAAYDDTTLHDIRDDNYDALGSNLELGALLQAKVWRIAARAQLRASLQNMDLREGDTSYYDGAIDIMREDATWAITHDADLLFLAGALKVGVRHSLVHTFYSDELAAGTEDNAPTQRIGPAVVLTLFQDRPGAAWNEVSLALLAQWWLQHRYRTGEDTSQGIPYALVALIQRGDVVPHKKAWQAP
jgi:hypothetical protein